MLRFLRLAARTGIAVRREGDCTTNCDRRKAKSSNQVCPQYRHLICDDGHLIGLLDLFGVAVFAVTGALTASRKQMDIVGFALLATVTGIGGGTLRDLVLGAQPVFWVREPVYVAVCIARCGDYFFHRAYPGIRATGCCSGSMRLGFRSFAWPAPTSALVADAGWFIAIVMGVITATFGGVVRDVLGGEIPVILRREIYVTAAWPALRFSWAFWQRGLPAAFAALAGFAALPGDPRAGLAAGLVAAGLPSAAGP